MKFEKTKDKITLHGLGFLQVVLPGNQRLHVWHPDLPRRKCFESSNIHNHRFEFTSRVLVGTQININYKLLKFSPDGTYNTHTAYLHEGSRTKFGNRPWVKDFKCKPVEYGRMKIEAGGKYKINTYDYHSTQAEGIVVTLMTKLFEGDTGAHSLCKVDIEPDADFDRRQMSQGDLWDIFSEAIKSAPGEIPIVKGE